MNQQQRAQVRLFALVILAFLPAAVLYVITAGRLEEHERARQEDRIATIATLAAVEYQRLIDDSRQFLAALAEFPEVRDGAPGECNRRLALVLRHTPQFTTLSLIGPDGYMVCGSLPVEGGLYLGDRAYYLLATTNGQFSVGEYAVGRITGKPTVGVAYPIAEGTLRQVRKVLAASLDLSGIGSYTRPLQLPPYTTFTVLDRDGTVMVRQPAGRHPLGQDSVGAQADAGFPGLAGGGDEATPAVGTDLDGVVRRFAVVPLGEGAAGPRGLVAVGTEEAMLVAEAEGSVRAQLRFLAGAGLVILVLTWLLGHYGLVRGERAEGEPAPAEG